MENFNPSYTGERKDILNLVPKNVKRVLDIGCSNGALGEDLKENFNTEVVGIEIDKDMAEIAKKKIDKVILADLEKINFEDYLKLEYFDVIIFADILEHIRNPWILVKSAKKLLKENGIIIASIPNIRHYKTIFDLLVNGSWPYNDRGIHDKNHLRFFTLKSIKLMFKDIDFKIIKIRRNYRIIEKPHKLNKLSFLISFPLLKNFLTFQYLIVAKKTKLVNSSKALVF